MILLVVGCQALISGLCGAVLCSAMPNRAERSSVDLVLREKRLQVVRHIEEADETGQLVNYIAHGNNGASAQSGDAPSRPRKGSV
jgi:hypothetical protein